MKAVLTFDLSDPDDRMAHRRYMQADAMASALFDLSNELRDLRKYAEESECTFDNAEKAFWEVLAENGINLDEL